MTGNVPNPKSTGGAGTTYEQRVGAMFLAYLLTRGIPPIFRNSRVEAVGFQTKIYGWETDDLLVTCLTEKNGTCKLAIQIKRSFRVQRRWEKCVKTFQEFWKTFNEAKKFDPDQDALVLATPRSNNSLKDLEILSERARASFDAEDFKRKLGAKGSLPSTVESCRQVIRDIVEKIGSSDVNEGRFWHFLKTIHVLFIDLTTSTSLSEGLARQLLEMSARPPDASGTAEATWHRLVTLAADGAHVAQTLRRSDLPADILEKHDPSRVSDFDALAHHSNTVLESINLTIAGDITLPRKDKIAETVAALEKHRVVVLTGPPGSGKSVLAKKVVRQHAGNRTCLSFRAEEFAESHIERALPSSISGMPFETLLGLRKIVIHVESLERLLDHSTQQAFSDLVGIAERCPNVCLLVTCRGHAFPDAWLAFFERSSLTFDEVKVPPLNEEEIKKVKAAFPSLEILLSRPGLSRLLCIPYFLDMAANMDWSDPHDVPLNCKAFREKCWHARIRNNSHAAAGLPERRERAILDISVRRARELRPFVPTEGSDAEAVAALCDDGIIIRNETGLAAPAHDILEDWAIMRWIEQCIAELEWQARPLAMKVGTRPAIRRGFREWLKEALDLDADRAAQFALSTYSDSSLSNNFRDDVMVSVLLSRSVRGFISGQKDRILKDDAKLLISLIRLTRAACTQRSTSRHDQNATELLLLEPEGDAWSALLEIVADRLEVLLPGHVDSMLDLLEDWSLGANISSPIPDGAASAGQIAYRLLEHLTGYDHDNLRKRVMRIIARVPCCDKSRFLDLIGQTTDMSNRHDSLSEEFGKLLIEGVDGLPACRDFPEQMAQLTRSICCLPEQVLERGSEYGAYDVYIEPEFGLRPSFSLNFLPRSAFRGPFLYLLKLHPLIGLELILGLVNHAGDWYGKRKWPKARLESARSITISIPGCDNVPQWANERLWLAYRGTSCTPHVIQCALMALESWLLDLPKGAVNDFDSLLLGILQKSNNVMTAAVVASVCNARPDLCGAAALTLLRSRECIELDGIRAIKESEVNMLFAFPSIGPAHKLYNSERRESNARPHRHHSLVALALNLQGHAEQVQEIIDGHRAAVPHATSRTNADRLWLLTLHRMDRRNLDVRNATYSRGGNSSEHEAGEAIAVPFSSDGLDSDLQNFVNTGNEEIRRRDPAISLWLWGTKRWEQNTMNGDADTWRATLASAREVRQSRDTRGIEMVQRDGPVTVAAVCVRDHFEELTADEREWCIATLIAEIERNSGSTEPGVLASIHQSSPVTLAARVIPKALAYNSEDPKTLEAVAKAVTHPSPQVSIDASDGVAEYLQPQHLDLLLRCAGAVAMFSNLFVRKKQQQIREGVQWLPGGINDIQNLWRQARDAFVQGTIDTERELENLDLASHHGRYASERILLMLSKSPDLAITKDLFIRTGQKFVETWAAGHSMQDTPTYSGFNDSMMLLLARIILDLPSHLVSPCCEPFLDAVDGHPDEISFLVELLVIEEDKRSNKTCFWDIWQAFADRIVDAPWFSQLGSNHSTRAPLVDKMLLKLVWKKGARSWRHLVGHEEQVNRFVIKLPAVPLVLAALVHYLYAVGETSLPNAFVIVAELLRKGDPANMLSNQSTVSYLEALLKRYVYDQPARLKTDPELRNAVTDILDRLVETGSSAAYTMRNDFMSSGSDPSFQSTQT